ncbi:hypothetical protein HPB51_028086 [Rhipicephalus microplus]|uniref:Uncharacterized protein n=1 Tax=Rhipicephalus microplus TaxID=6941 RepID=A0A9J6CY98_RHIMP|nr:hypothetical protein HPB51_028086 [Rhipicephalus microplus]
MAENMGGAAGLATSSKRAALLLLHVSDSSESQSSSSNTSHSSNSYSGAEACAYERAFDNIFRVPAKRPKVIRFVEDVIQQYLDHEFRRHFRLTRPVAEKFIAEFAASSMCPSTTHGGVLAKSAETLFVRGRPERIVLKYFVECFVQQHRKHRHAS